MPMNNNYYNEEDKNFNVLINTLKSLPQVSAPSDFEMNLQRKLNNLRHAEKHKDKESFFFFRKSFVPAAALALSVAVVFFMLFDFRTTEENPFMANPELKAEYSSNVNTTSIKNLLIDPINITSNDVVIKKKTSSPQPVVRPKKDVPQETFTGLAGTESQPNIREFLNSNRGQNVDRSMRAKPQSGGALYNDNSQIVSFDGFNLVNEDNDQTLYQLKARMDSLKKMMRRSR